MSQYTVFRSSANDKYPSDLDPIVIEADQVKMENWEALVFSDSDENTIAGFAAGTWLRWHKEGALAEDPRADVLKSGLTATEVVAQQGRQNRNMEFTK